MWRAIIPNFSKVVVSEDVGSICDELIPFLGTVENFSNTTQNHHVLFPYDIYFFSSPH